MSDLSWFIRFVDYIKEKFTWSTDSAPNTGTDLIQTYLKLPLIIVKLKSVNLLISVWLDR